MAYSDFSLEQVSETFGVHTRRIRLFDDLTPLPPSDWLQETLRYSLSLGLISGNEKARSEFIVMPVLLELVRRHPDQLVLFSGKNFTVDKASGLTGECDFLFSKGELSKASTPHPKSLSQVGRGTLIRLPFSVGLRGWGMRANDLPVWQSPLFLVVQAKKQDLELGLGQCAAQLVGALRFNRVHNPAIDTVFGCVTTGETWQFLQLFNQHLSIDRTSFYINQLELLLGMLQRIVDCFSDPVLTPTLI